MWLGWWECVGTGPKKCRFPAARAPAQGQGATAQGPYGIRLGWGAASFQPSGTVKASGPRPDGGTSAVAANLAAALSQKGARPEGPCRAATQRLQTEPIRHDLRR